jgi:hypothetical protein
VEELQEMSRNMEDVVIVDLDDDRVTPPGSQDTDAALLPPFVAPLRATIEDASKRTRNRMTLTNLSSNSNRKVRISPHPGSGLRTDFRRRRGGGVCVVRTVVEGQHGGAVECVHRVHGRLARVVSRVHRHLSRERW